MWKDAIEDFTNRLPVLNEDLLLRFRKEGMDSMVRVLDQTFRDSLSLFKGSVEYRGYRVLGPIEASAWRIRESVKKGKVSVAHNSRTLVEFMFRIDDLDYPMHIQLPFVEDGCVWLEGGRFFPLFTLIERMVHVSVDEQRVDIKVDRLLMVFRKSKSFALKSEEDHILREVCITAKLHLSRRASRSEICPLLLYHLVDYGMEALKYYGFADGDLELTDKVRKHQDFVHFKIGPGYIRVRKSKLQTLSRKRVVIALSRILNGSPNWFEEINQSQNMFLKFILGKFTAPTNMSRTPPTMIKHAEDHLLVYRILLDAGSRITFNRAGWECESISDLLYIVHENMDEWLMREPRNLYTKKIAAMEVTLAPLIVKINKTQYESLDKRSKLVDPTSFRKHTRSVSSMQPRWFLEAETFRAEPDIVNSNWLMSIGLKEIRKLDNSGFNTGKGKKGGQGKGTKTPTHLLISHPSWLPILSLYALPSSKPVITGSVNSFLHVDEDGQFIVPQDLKEKIKHVFD